MNFFTNVAIVTDHTMAEDADAIRGVLESFRLRVDFYRLVQKPQVTRFFQQDRQYPYTIVFCHGSGDPPDDLHLAIEVVDQKDGRYEEPQDWFPVTIKMTPSFVKDNMRGRSGTLVSVACGSGRRPLADAFVDAGYDAYIAPVEPYYDSQAGIAFLTSLFYFLLAEDRDYAKTTFSEEEAVRMAAALDQSFKYGSMAFRRYTRDGYDPAENETRNYP